MTLLSWRSVRPRQDGLWVVAHRGASMHHRESSPEAFEAAIAAGADAVETDVRRTADGVLICHHDATLIRTAGLDQAISSLTFLELRDIAPDYCVPLTEVLERTRGRINVLLDLKLVQDQDITELVLLLQERQVGDHVAIGTRLLPSQALINQLSPAQPQLGLLGSPDDAAPFVAAGGCWVRLWERDATSERIAAIQNQGAPVLIMVGGEGTDRLTGHIDRSRIAELVALGVDGLMLDDPALARN